MDINNENHRKRMGIHTFWPAVIAAGSALGSALLSRESGRAATSSAEDAARTQAQAQQRALAYMRQREALPQHYREEALRSLGGLYGLSGEDGGPTGPAGGDFFSQLQESPLYQGLMQGQQAGEESVLRQASTTGGLRSGNVQDALAQFNADLQNKALLTTYGERVSGLQGMAGLPSNAPLIAQQMGNIGATQAMGITGAAATRSQADQQFTNALMQATGLGLQAYQAYSDIRLKQNIRKIGKILDCNVYSWTWNALARSLDLKGDSHGFIAQEIQKKYPKFVGECSSFLFIQYNKLLEVLL